MNVVNDEIPENNNTRKHMYRETIFIQVFSEYLKEKLLGVVTSTHLV